MEPALRGQNNEAGDKLRVRLREINWADLDGRLQPTVANFLRLMTWLIWPLANLREMVAGGWI